MNLIQYAAYEAHQHYGLLSLGEYESEGYMAMYSIVVTYDPTRGPFKSYAIPRLRGALLDAVRKMYPSIEADGAAAGAPRPAHLDRNAAPGPVIPMDSVIDPVSTMGSVYVKGELREIIRECVSESRLECATGSCGRRGTTTGAGAALTALGGVTVLVSVPILIVDERRAAQRRGP